MKGIENSIVLGIGNLSKEPKLGAYYQDISPSIVHISTGVFASKDEEGIPYCIENNKKKYYVVLTIQYSLMCYDLIQKGVNIDENTEIIKKCLNWLDKEKEYFKGSYIWRSEYNIQYRVEKGWISGMYQGQAISLYLRAFQLFNDNAYLDTAEKVLNSFSIDYKDGGFKRIDESGCIWFEEYPTEKPSYVLNGFIYAILGIFDFYRVTGSQDSLNLWNLSVKTLEINIHKYDVWYWSVYDQLKKQLVSYYYQKNVHIPLMQIMYGLTSIELFDYYAKKWQRNLENPFHRFVTQIMYRIKPRIRKFAEK